ncbi:MAG: HAD family hydrolase [Candidatus Sumerlaeota bacterium]|nr:HAD family hydrolase [Candidatus Sumerlaeota bacterium]
MKKRANRRTVDAARPAVFLDRDGTVNEDFGYINHPSRIKLLPGAARAIRRLNEAGLPVIIVSNQGGVAMGYFPEENVRLCNQRLRELLKARGAYVNAIYCNPYRPSGTVKKYARDSPLRKPQPGMLDKARREHGIDLPRSYMAGDRPSDIECARSRGLKAIFVRTGYGEGELHWNRSKWKSDPDFIARTLNEAVSWILKDIMRSCI